MEKKPVDFYPTAEDFVGEGGNFERPYAIVKNAEGVKAGTRIEGLEAVGGLHFSEVTLEPEEECSYLIFTGITEKIFRRSGIFPKLIQPRDGIGRTGKNKGILAGKK